MKTVDFDRLLQLMLEKGFSQVDITNGRRRIAMKLATAPDAAAISASAQVARAPASPVELRSPAIGTLLERHPLHPADEGEPVEGRRVVAGEPVAYVRAGNLLSAVVAPAVGRLGRRLWEPGQLVGYATPVFEFFPDEDGKAAKG
ncbi:hypothetical protein LXM94_10230 [Rhizobium sp. TRM95111]|uniref:hypothetical protein n=1 Tax=Rhizobium alarense TaxID=2846851 RepID=UPI001F1AFCF7|nr:hypothetical protein [Rhizobium alarense]MCF3640341.1 hypothetical protein [Rhizobium alarense]